MSYNKGFDRMCCDSWPTALCLPNIYIYIYILCMQYLVLFCRNLSAFCHRVHVPAHLPNIKSDEVRLMWPLGGVMADVT